jgi:hypothetical protein
MGELGEGQIMVERGCATNEASLFIIYLLGWS